MLIAADPYQICHFPTRPSRAREVDPSGIRSCDETRLMIYHRSSTFIGKSEVRFCIPKFWCLETPCKQFDLLRILTGPISVSQHSIEEQVRPRWCRPICRSPAQWAIISLPRQSTDFHAVYSLRYREGISMGNLERSARWGGLANDSQGKTLRLEFSNNQTRTITPAEKHPENRTDKFGRPVQNRGWAPT